MESRGRTICSGNEGMVTGTGLVIQHFSDKKMLVKLEVGWGKSYIVRCRMMGDVKSGIWFQAWNMCRIWINVLTLLLSQFLVISAMLAHVVFLFVCGFHFLSPWSHYFSLHLSHTFWFNHCKTTKKPMNNKTNHLSKLGLHLGSLVIHVCADVGVVDWLFGRNFDCLHKALVHCHVVSKC